MLTVPARTRWSACCSLCSDDIPCSSASPAGRPPASHTASPASNQYIRGQRGPGKFTDRLLTGLNRLGLLIGKPWSTSRARPHPTRTKIHYWSIIIIIGTLWTSVEHLYFSRCSSSLSILPDTYLCHYSAKKIIAFLSMRQFFGEKQSDHKGGQGKVL